ncbi:MAG: LuxR C-terminal-related transcriptional regulator, partial [Parahaliea sp.]
SMIATHHFPQARSLLTFAQQRLAFQNNTYMAGLADTMESIIDLYQGHLGAALARLRTTAATPSNDMSHSSSESLGNRLSNTTLLAVALYETDQLEEAEKRLLSVLSYNDISSTDGLISRHILLSRIAYHRGDRHQCMRYLAELERYGQGASSRVISSARLERARIATIEDNLDTAEEALNAAEQMNDWLRPGVTFYANDIDSLPITRWRLEVAKGSYEPSATELAQAIAEARHTHHHRRRLKLHLLHALALDGKGQRDRAFEELAQALHTGSHEGFLRSFLDEGSPIIDLIKRWSQAHQGQHPPPGIEPNFVSELLKHAGEEEHKETRETAIAGASPDQTLEALTTREAEVLRLLAEGHRNRVIADKLFLSEFTVKSHLRNINAKLGAKSRTEAVAIARAQQLID